MEIFSDATATSDVLLAMTQCVHMSPEFAKAEPFPSDSPLSLALYDSSACPDSLDMTQEQYVDKFKGKVAVWLSYEPSDISCDPFFFQPQKWYKRVVDAGAIGVVTLVPLEGQHAGTYFDYFSRSALFDGSVLENMEVSEYIPFIICANPNAEGEGVYSQDTLTSFLDNWYADPSERTAPFNNDTLSIGNITVSDNPWIDLYKSTLYMVGFRVIIPIMYFFATILCVFFLYERLLDVSKARRGLSCASCSPPLMALVIQTLLSLFFFIFYVTDGWGSNLDSPIVGLRLLFFSQLVLISAGATILVGLTFSDIRQNHKRMRRISQNSSFIVRHRIVLIVSAAVMMVTEIVSMFTKSQMSRDEWSLLLTIACVIALGVGVWFAVEARVMAGIIVDLTRMSSQTTAVNDDNKGSELSSLRHHIVVWTSVATVMLMLVVLLGFFATLHPYFIFRVENWGVFWFILSAFRAIYTIAMILLLRLPRSTKRGAGTNPATPTSPDSNFSITKEGLDVAPSKL